MKKHNLKRPGRSGAATQPTMPWRFFFLTIICACVLAAGFFFAARQHFLTIDLGLRNSKMRKQIEDLEAERRRLILAKEVSLSPGEITRTAQLMGFREKQELPQPVEIKVIKPREEVETMLPMQTAFKATGIPTSDATKPKVPPKLVKQIVQQIPAKAPATTKERSINERPRIVGNTDKNIARSPALKTLNPR